MYVYIFVCSSQVGGNRQGYMGHLIKIVNQIVLCGESDCNLGQIINDTMEEDIQKSWKEFISGTVADTNRKNETNLVSLENYFILNNNVNRMKY